IQPITPLPSIPTPIAPILPTPIIVPPAAPQPVPSQLVENCDQNSICSQVRQLYSQQIFWNRILLNSIVDRTGQQNANTQRLMQNSVDMGHFYAKHYGNQAGQQIQDLFAQHNSIGRDLFIAMRDRRNAEGDRLRMQWYNNADQLSEYMGNLIPEIDSQELRRMMFHYLGSAELQAAQLISNNAQGSITTFDNIEREAMSMADYISNAIIGERLS
ncbi:MAG: hypothetical protein FWF58_00140, partial [Firmicutes bacterium]|nr:hypothetical protein [Bacillota bacterium]